MLLIGYLPQPSFSLGGPLYGLTSFERRMLSLYHQQGSCAVLGPLFVLAWSYSDSHTTITQPLGTLAACYNDHRYVLPPPDICSYIMVHGLFLSVYRETVPVRRTWHGHF